MFQKALHVISSYSLLVVIFLINKKIGIISVLAYFGIPINCDLPLWVSYIIYITITIGYALILTRLFDKLRPGELRKENIEVLDADNSGLLAMVLAYVFVGLSISNVWALLIVVFFLFIFNLFGSSHIFNPIFYLFGYHYYFVSSAKTKFLVMSKTKYPMGAEADFSNCRCLNDYTYIDMTN